VTSENDDTVRRYDGATGIFTGIFVSAGSGGLDAPFDLVFGPGAAAPVPALNPVAQVALFALMVAGAVGIARRGSRATLEDEA
jgi:hypothetical protein